MLLCSGQRSLNRPIKITYCSLSKFIGDGISQLIPWSQEKLVGCCLQERQAQSGAQDMLKSLGLSREPSPERETLSTLDAKAASEIACIV